MPRLATKECIYPDSLSTPQCVSFSSYGGDLTVTPGEQKKVSV